MMKRANPAFVVSTNNTKIVPNRKKATLKEIEDFKKDLKKHKEEKAKGEEATPNTKKAKSEDKS